MHILLIYLCIINVISFALMGIDKHKAIHHKYRISEKSLFISALLFGAAGSCAGMQHFRHKTKHKQFVFGMPLILIVQLVLLFYVINSFL